MSPYQHLDGRETHPMTRNDKIELATRLMGGTIPGLLWNLLCIT